MGKKVTLEEYQILTADTPGDLVECVQEAIDKGWLPIGGPSCTAVAETLSSVKQIYIQAVGWFE